MRRTLILIAGLLVAGFAAQAIPKDIKEKKTTLIEHVAFVDQVAEVTPVYEVTPAEVVVVDVEAVRFEILNTSDPCQARRIPPERDGDSLKGKPGILNATFQPPRQ